ncbi:MAG: vanadium-dependent haloperoxidase [Calditrichaeota bacterium]|nr:vanadium-dependent haloperoxidase [Calditrichota bacterium]
MEKTKRNLFRRIVFGALVVSAALFMGCDKDDDNNPPPPSLPVTADFDADAATAWIQTSRAMVKMSGTVPPVAARAYAYLGQSLYESVVGGMPDHISLSGQIYGMPQIPAADPNLEYHWPSAANAAGHEILTFLFASADPAVLALADNQFNALHDQYATGVAADVLERSETYGRFVGTIIEVCANADGYEQHHNCSYDWTAHAGEGLWEPTPPAFVSTPVEPCWGEMRPLVLSDAGTECYPDSPPAYSTDPASQFYIEMMEVYNTVEANVQEERNIAYFWADGGGTSTPPGHWLSITAQVLDMQNANLATAVEIYCKVGVAVNDAFISCWKSKFDYNYIRPVTAINDLVTGAENWLPPVVTPPFPECTSGHSTQSGAAYIVLEDFFGDVAFTDTTGSAMGFAPRSFSGTTGASSFQVAAWEAAYSRLYGGIHFRTACESGVTQGMCIGLRVNALQFRATS